MNETLMETFKRYYADYRGSANMEQSFTDAYQAMAYHVIEQTDHFAQGGNLEAIQNMIREYKEIGLAVAPSNDALKERFEQELVEEMLNRGHS
ncbi:hypothetical protein [Paenibacillus aceris]|uniref:Uncharacterized protein n=1 Tax=Paenibacillus aceris TaxID=869555 RepID=A0ABS4I9T8_9BACL|nr:hypothetical protein [Paenibacillus aceris]MBP1966834.1 hypothetical protein [Paenibacillus aceris]NHW39459.1 hypothetical protein [Paenibacillus aceris]